MFQKIDKKLIKEVTGALEFYDLYGHFPWDKKKICVTVPYESYIKIKENGTSKVIQNCLIKK